MKNSDGFPFWVKLGLMGIDKRSAAMAWLWSSIFIAGSSVVLGLVVDQKFFLGSVFVLASLWYWSCIRWVDQKGKWG